ncbi:Uncharacterised protein [Mycobacterium tuberculosis]|nr:Uncharacterised protein [Mycobacterium tuberculosis]
MLAGVVAAGMFNDGNVNPGRLKAPTGMLAGVVAAGMFNDGNVNPGRLKAPTVMLAGVVAAGMVSDGSVIAGRLKAGTDIPGICSGGRVRSGVVILNCRLPCPTPR